MKTNWIKSLTAGLVAALIAPTCACASQLTNKSPLRGVSSLTADSSLKIDFQNRSNYQFEAISGGIDGSGGGSVIKCVVGGKTQYTLLDYQEAAQRNIQVDLGAKSLSVGQKIETVLGRLTEINPARAKYYAQLANAYQDNVDMRTGVNFGKTPDVVDEIIPKGCERVQVVIQLNPELPGDKRFVTNADVWSQLDSETKAGIILHEIAYYDQGMKSARKLRYFNAVMASLNLASMNLEDYYTLLTSTDMIGEKGYNVTANSSCLGDAKFDANNEVLFANSCKINEKNFHVGQWGTYFDWMAGTKDLTVLALADLYEQRLEVSPNKKSNEIHIGDVKIKWLVTADDERFENLRYLEAAPSLKYEPSEDREAEGRWQRSLFDIKTSSASVQISTNKETLTIAGRQGLPCPKGFSIEDGSWSSNVHIYQILKSKVVLAYVCEDDENEYAPEKIIYKELQR